MELHSPIDLDKVEAVGCVELVPKVIVEHFCLDELLVFIVYFGIKPRCQGLAPDVVNALTGKPHIWEAVMEVI